MRPGLRSISCNLSGINAAIIAGQMMLVTLVTFHGCGSHPDYAARRIWSAGARRLMSIA